MSSTSTYLNFPRCTLEAFEFYRSVFGGEFEGKIYRFSDVPPHEGQSPIPEADKNLIMHIALPILGNHLLMGTDAPESMGFKIQQGNTIYINLEPDTRAEANRLFYELSVKGMVEQPLQVMFWGGYYGSIVDQYGVHWMINCIEK